MSLLPELDLKVPKKDSARSSSCSGGCLFLWVRSPAADAGKVEVPLTSCATEVVVWEKRPQACWLC